MKTNKQVAFSCRLPHETFEKVQSLLQVSQKSVAVFCKDAIEEYMSQITKDNYKESNSLKIDKYAWKINERK